MLTTNFLCRKGGYEPRFSGIAKVQKLSESCVFWITFIVLKKIKSLIFSGKEKRFRQLCFKVVVQNV